MPLQTLMHWSIKIFEKKLSFPLYPEAPLLNGMELPSKLLLLEKISEPTLLPDFQMDETNCATDLKWSMRSKRPRKSS